MCVNLDLNLTSSGCRYLVFAEQIFLKTDWEITIAMSNVENYLI